jgi:hypothetical protein
MTANFLKIEVRLKSMLTKLSIFSFNTTKSFAVSSLSSQASRLNKPIPEKHYLLSFIKTYKSNKKFNEINMNNVLYYGTHPSRWETHYGNVQRPFEDGKEICTQLPKNIVVIRAAAVAVFTTLAAIKLSASILCWPVAIAGMGYAGWTIYSNFIALDPLMEAFYKISGGQERFEAFPEINLAQAPDEKISAAIARINWEDLNHPVSRTRTLDGRNVVIIKGFERNSVCKSIDAYIEKVGPEDIPRSMSNLPELADAFIHALSDFATEGNTYSKELYQRSAERRDCTIFPWILSDRANELYVQMNPA